MIYDLKFVIQELFLIWSQTQGKEKYSLKIQKTVANLNESNDAVTEIQICFFYIFFGYILNVSCF